MDPDVCEAAKYASLWESKELTQVTKKKLFWVILKMDLRTTMSQKPQLSPVLFQEYHSITDFKAYFHHAYIHAKKYLEEVWYELPYLVSKEDILLIIRKWSSN